MTIVTFLNKLNKLDLQAVEKQLMSSYGWTLEKTQVAINRYKLYLHLKSLYPAVMLVPTQEIDLVWHTHIEVNLIKYIQDCYYLFGYILNHCSAISSEQNDGTLQIYEQSFGKTKALFGEMFGVDILENTSFQIAACADLPINTNPTTSADLQIIPNY